ncbi:APC family permease [Clostridium thermobutyricum]|uniref:APC family permease n=1 Tax=Clostridium thermobutyricum TaxID=29372 RepID=UPI003F51E4A7
MSKKSKIGFLSIVLLGFNAIVGSGIFLLPNKAMALIGPASLGVILFDAFLAITIALCFAEVGGKFKNNGGPYLYTKEAFGIFPAFEVGFMTYAICIIAAATMAVGFTTALSVFFPAASHGITKDILIIGLLILLAIMNLAGVNLSKIVINVSTIGKLIPLVIFIAVGIFFIKGGNFTPVFPHGTYTHGSFGSAALLIFFSFTGFESIALAAEDMDSPSKNIPKAIVVVMLLVSVIYMLIQAISIGILGPKLATDLTPVATASSEILGPFGGILVSLGILVSIIGINATQAFLTPRLGMALANDGLFPRIMAKTDSRGVPYVSVIVSTIITIPIALSGSFTHLALISSISRFAQYLPTCLAVLVLRKKRPELDGSFKIPFGPVIPIIAMAVSIWILTQSDLQKIVWGLGGLILAIPLYFFMRYYNKRKNIEFK